MMQQKMCRMTQLRLRYGISQADLAKAAGVSRQLISLIELDTASQSKGHEALLRRAFAAVIESRRMDCRSLAALTLSSWLLRSGYMTTALGCFIHIGHAVLHSLIGNKYSGLSRSKTGVCLCSCLLTCAGRSRRSASTTRATARRRRRRRCARIGAWFRGTSARAATLSAFAANRMSGGLCNGASDALDNCISYHAGKSAAKPVSGKGGV